MGSEVDPGRDLDRYWALARLSEARVGRLGTVGPSGAARLVPICFTVAGACILSAVDQKPKTTTALARLADVTRTGRATVLVDHYDDTDWSVLWWVRVTGPATVHQPEAVDARAAVIRLAQKYPQYRTMPPLGPVLSIEMETVTSWRAQDPGS